MDYSQMKYTKCPSHDSELEAWSTLYPRIREVVWGDADSITLAKELAVLKNVDKKDNLIEYGFTGDGIKEIVESYKEDTHSRDEVEKSISETRAREQEEILYINNKIREWEDYEVPAVDHGYYRIGKAGIFRVVESIDEETKIKNVATKDVCRTPFVICGISESIRDEPTYYKIRYAVRDTEIREFWGSQSELLSRKELKTLFLSKEINCPENSLLLETLEYISRSIAEFGPRLYKEYSAKQNGWNEDKSLFVIGNQSISKDGIKPILSVGSIKGYPELEEAGTLENWIKGVKGILEYNVIRFKCYDALTAPLKSILGIESHATDHYGNTSCGKTFSAQIALSMIGDAEELTIGAKSTAKGILVHIRDFSDLPILIDESSDAGEHLADLVYPLTSNKGRVKSTQDGQRDGGEEFHTTTMFTGERPIRDCLQNSGQQYRVNELEDTLPDLPTKEINAVKVAIRENHGHIIKLYIKKVLDWKENGNLQTIYDNCFDVLPENTSNIEGRSRSIFACIMTAGKILETVFKEIGMPTRNQLDIVSEYFKKCIQDKPVELEYIRALRILLDWAHSDYGRFTQIKREIKGYDEFEYPTTNDKTKRLGYVDDDYIDIIQTEFTKKITSEGFSPSKIKEDLWKQGITLANDTQRQIYRTSRKGFGSYACIRIVRSIAESVTGYAIIDSKKLPQDNKIIAQDEKIRFIMKTVQLLTEIHGEADIQLIRPILNYPDIDELLKILVQYGKLLKTTQSTYKTV